MAEKTKMRAFKTRSFHVQTANEISCLTYDFSFSALSMNLATSALGMLLGPSGVK